MCWLLYTPIEKTKECTVEPLKTNPLTSELCTYLSPANFQNAPEQLPSPLKANTSELRIVNTSLALAHSSNDKLTSKKANEKPHPFGICNNNSMNENIIIIINYYFYNHHYYYYKAKAKCQFV